MKMKTMVLMMVAVACGLVAMVGVQQALSNRDGMGDIEKAKVLVAIAEVQTGFPLDDSNVALKSMPVEAIPEGAVFTLEEYEQRAPKIRLYPGQVVLKAQLGEKGEYGAAMEIPKGMQVATLSVNATMTHSGLLKPGDRVDILVTYQGSKVNVGTVYRSKVVLQAVQIWATDNVRMGNDRPDTEIIAKNVSVLVYPWQARLLKLAESKGQLHMTLRSRYDTAPESEMELLEESALEERISALFEDREDKPTNIPFSATAKPEPVEAPTKFQDFVLNQQSTPEPTPVAIKKTWKIEIYHGEDKRVQEVEVPESPEEAAVRKAKSHTQANGSINVLNVVGQLFGGQRGAKANGTKPGAGHATDAAVSPGTRPEDRAPAGESDETDGLRTTGRGGPGQTTSKDTAVQKR